MIITALNWSDVPSVRPTVEKRWQKRWQFPGVECVGRKIDSLEFAHCKSSQIG
jgi:hypothetical protein